MFLLLAELVNYPITLIKIQEPKGALISKYASNYYFFFFFSNTQLCAYHCIRRMECIIQEAVPGQSEKQ